MWQKGFQKYQFQKIILYLIRLITMRLSPNCFEVVVVDYIVLLVVVVLYVSVAI